MIANVGVIEAGSNTPNDFVFLEEVQASYPPGGAIGMLDADQNTIEYGMLKVFAYEATNLFIDHKVTVDP